MTTLPASIINATPAGRPRSIAARNFKERIILGLLIFCGLFTVVTTISIIGILAMESYKFFTEVSVTAQGDEVTVTFWEFITGLEWNPLLGAEKHFGIWPLIAGTMMVSVIAMAFALPLGLITAIWLSEFAPTRARNVIKPVLEILAGIPTVVFGFFALTFITPLLRFEWWQRPALGEDGLPILDSAGNVVTVAANPLNFGSYNAMAAGLAVGIMCLPIVTSLSEDALRAVPRSLKEGAYGLGCSRFEASIKVVVPSALSGIIAAFLLAIARAVGETMIVALAAGAAPLPLHSDPTAVLDPRNQIQPMTGYMVQIFLGDVEHGGVEYLSCYTVAATLFVITLGLTILGGIIRKRFRQAYE
ncbi:MAG: phosphate ABC transporter permease subunit PstC [Planctomycetota bacterium]